MDAEQVRATFERWKTTHFDPRLVGVSGSYRFDVAGVGSIVVSVEDGRLSASESTLPADLVVTCAPDVFLRVADGRQNLVTAAMQGLVGLQGDLSLAQKLHGILRPSDEEVRP